MPFKRTVISVLVILLFLCLSAEEKTEERSLSDALSASDVAVGGYGALSMRFTGLGSNNGSLSSESCFAYLIGVKGGVTLNRSFTVGAGFHVLVNDIKYECSDVENTEYYVCRDPHDNYEVDMSFGYGGLYLSYLFKINGFVGVDLGVLVGGGVFKPATDDEYENRDIDGYSFFAVEPELELVIKITHFLGIGLGGGYRYIGLSDSKTLYDWKDLSGFSVNFDVRLGVL